jgi:integrase
MPRHREGPTKNQQTGYYYFDQYVGLGPDRRRLRISLGTKDPARAQWLWEQEYKRRWSDHYGLKTHKTTAPIKFSDAIKEFIAYERDVKRVSEWKIFEKRLEIVSRIWGIVRISDLGREHIAALDKALREKRGVSPYTINHYFGLLKTFFYWAIGQEKHSGPNPMKEVKPYVVDRRRRSFTPEEIRKIIAAAEKIETLPRARDITLYANRLVKLLLYTGMRFGEAVNLRWENVHEDKIALKRTETKQRKEKVIPITAGIRAVLDTIPRGAQTDFVFPFRRRASGRVYQKWILEKIREHSGVKDFEFHGLRHTAATLMVSEAQGRGVGLADIMKVLGHSRVETTLRYLHEDESRMRRAVEIVEEKFSGKKKR